MHMVSATCPLGPEHAPLRPALPSTGLCFLVSSHLAGGRDARAALDLQPGSRRVQGPGLARIATGKDQRLPASSGGLNGDLQCPEAAHNKGNVMVWLVEPYASACAPSSTSSVRLLTSSLKRDVPVTSSCKFCMETHSSQEGLRGEVICQQDARHAQCGQLPCQ